MADNLNSTKNFIELINEMMPDGYSFDIHGYNPEKQEITYGIYKKTDSSYRAVYENTIWSIHNPLIMPLWVVVSIVVEVDDYLRSMKEDGQYLAPDGLAFY